MWFMGICTDILYKIELQQLWFGLKKNCGRLPACICLIFVCMCLGWEIFLVLQLQYYLVQEIHTHTSTNTHIYVGSLCCFVFITLRPQWDWIWPVTESRWTPSSQSVLSCVSRPVHHSLSYPPICANPPFTWPGVTWSQGSTDGWPFMAPMCVNVCVIADQ